jgi:hypothetical protein
VLGAQAAQNGLPRLPPRRSASILSSNSKRHLQVPLRWQKHRLYSMLQDRRERIGIQRVRSIFAASVASHCRAYSSCKQKSSRWLLREQSR